MEPTRRLVNPSWFWVKFFGGLTVACLVAPLPLGLFGSHVLFVASGIGACLALGWGISTFVLWLQARRIDSRLADLPERALVHWIYTDDERRSYTDRLRKEADDHPKSGRLLGLFLGLLLGLGTGWGFMDSWKSTPLGSDFLGKGNVLFLTLAFGLLLGGCLGWLLGYWARWLAYNKADRILDAEAEAFLGADEAHCGEEYINWWQWRATLIDAYIDEEASPAMLSIWVAKGGGTRVHEMLEVPIPEGKKGEAREMCRKWKGE